MTSLDLFIMLHGICPGDQVVIRDHQNPGSSRRGTVVGRIFNRSGKNTTGILINFGQANPAGIPILESYPIQSTKIMHKFGDLQNEKNTK